MFVFYCSTNFRFHPALQPAKSTWQLWPFKRGIQKDGPLPTVNCTQVLLDNVEHEQNYAYTGADRSGINKSTLKGT